MLDLDLAFGDVAITLQQFPTRTVADAVVFGDRIDADALAGLVTAHSAGLDTLVAPDDPAMAESVPAATVTALIGALRQSYDVVVVDSPPAFTDQVLAAFDESDVVALLTTLDVPALKNLKLTLETLSLLSYPRERWRVVLNRADSKVGLEPRDVEKTLGVAVSLQIPSSREVPSSVNRGVPLVLDQPRHPVSLAIRAFAESEVFPAGGAPAAAAVPAVQREDRRIGLLRRRSVAP